LKTEEIAARKRGVGVRERMQNARSLAGRKNSTKPRRLERYPERKTDEREGGKI